MTITTHTRYHRACMHARRYSQGINSLPQNVLMQLHDLSDTCSLGALCRMPRAHATSIAVCCMACRTHAHSEHCVACTRAHAPSGAVCCMTCPTHAHSEHCVACTRAHATSMAVCCIAVAAPALSDHPSDCPNAIVGVKPPQIFETQITPSMQACWLISRTQLLQRQLPRNIRATAPTLSCVSSHPSNMRWLDSP